MKKDSVKPAKVTKVKPSKKPAKNTCPKCRKTFRKGMGLGFLIGFAVGSAIVAVIDYLDDKHKEMSRIEKGSDAEYYYTTE